MLIIYNMKSIPTNNQELTVYIIFIHMLPLLLKLQDYVDITFSLHNLQFSVKWATCMAHT